MSVLGRPREFDREEVLDRAMRLFWAHGYEGTAISELTAEMGIGRQSLYAAFGGKRELFEEALARYTEVRLVPVLEMLRAPGSPLENVRQVLGFLEQDARSADFQGCFIGHTIGELAVREPELAQRMGKKLLMLERGVEDALRRAQEVGELSEDKDPRALARMFITVMQGIAGTAQAIRSPSRVRDVIELYEQLLC